MPFPLNLLSPRTLPPSKLLRPLDEYDGNSSSSTDSNETIRSARASAITAAARPRVGLQRSSPTQASSAAAAVLGPPDFLLPPSANPSPVPSRSSSPLPIHCASPGASSSSYTSDADSEPTSPLLGLANSHRISWWNDDAHRWWLIGSRTENFRRRRRRLRRDPRRGIRTLTRHLRRLIRHPLFPTQPTSIILTLLIFTVIAILITLLLMHILNPDKASLPWRVYCSIPSTSTAPPSLTLSPTDESLTMQLPVGYDPTSPSESTLSDPFPPPYLDDIPPAGLFLGVFTTDSAVERRMLIRSTWASQKRSRAGAGEGDGGNGTSRTIVRFVLGKPRRDWERRIQLESESYNDMIQLPISENMNSGKTHAFFTWAAENAWVPPPSPALRLGTYSNHTAPLRLAPHDPQPFDSSRGWVRPDYVVKADDDSFVMLAELEARLRVELDSATRASAPQHASQPIQELVSTHGYIHSGANNVSPSPQEFPEVHLQSGVLLSREASYDPSYPTVPNGISPSFGGGLTSHSDPLIYWGYLVKNRFMAGELYALSWSLVSWVATEPAIKSMTHGAEDKQTAKWMRLHPRADKIRWATERCWIYDHPRAGTVYSHGFLFPSEAARVRRSILSLLRPVKSPRLSSESRSELPHSSSTTSSQSNLSGIGNEDTITYTLPSPLLLTTPSYSYSSVSQFGTHYTFPLATLTPLQSIEALVEGSAMSGLFEGGPDTAAHGWERREGRRKRYEGKRVGGTVVVHFIKRNEWFLEAALALLGGEEVLALEEGRQGEKYRESAISTAKSWNKEGIKGWAAHQAETRWRRW